MTIQHGEFHERDGWMFSRENYSGDVRIRNEAIGVQHTIPAASWCSILACLARLDTTQPVDYEAAKAFHLGYVPAAATPEGKPKVIDLMKVLTDSLKQRAATSTLAVIRAARDAYVASSGTPDHALVYIAKVDLALRAATPERDTREPR